MFFGLFDSDEDEDDLFFSSNDVSDYPEIKLKPEDEVDRSFEVDDSIDYDSVSTEEDKVDGWFWNDPIHLKPR